MYQNLINTADFLFLNFNGQCSDYRYSKELGVMSLSSSSIFLLFLFGNLENFSYLYV